MDKEELKSIKNIHLFVPMEEECSGIMAVTQKLFQNGWKNTGNEHYRMYTANTSWGLAARIILTGVGGKAKPAVVTTIHALNHILQKNQTNSLSIIAGIAASLNISKLRITQVHQPTEVYSIGKAILLDGNGLPQNHLSRLTDLRIGLMRTMQVDSYKTRHIKNLNGVVNKGSLITGPFFLYSKKIAAALLGFKPDALTYDMETHTILEALYRTAGSRAVVLRAASDEAGNEMDKNIDQTLLNLSTALIYLISQTKGDWREEF